MGATLGKTIQRGIARGGCANETGMGQRATVMPRPSVSAGVFEVVVDTLIVRSISAFGGARHRRPEGSRQLERGHSSGLFGCFRRLRRRTGFPLPGLFVLSAMIVIVFYAEKQAELRFGATGNKIVR